MQPAAGGTRFRQDAYFSGQGLYPRRHRSRHAYLVAAPILSDAVITREVHDGLSYNATFAASFPKEAKAARLATDVMGVARQTRSVIVLLASEKPVEAIECDAFATQ